jgi:hypothetical protein
MFEHATRSQAEPSVVWSDQQVIDGIETLARERGITSSVLVAAMTSVLLDPSMTFEQRAQALNRTGSSVAGSMRNIRRALQSDGSSAIRIDLAERIGMPFSAVVARIRVEGDPGLAKRVIDGINPSHREGVAELLLTARPGMDTDTVIYRVLDLIVRGGNFYVGHRTMAPQLGLPASGVAGALAFLTRSFGNERIQMLRTLGFSHEQILSMNPVGHELSKRFDPALGTYSAEEQALRQSKNLPSTREEAAERLLKTKAEDVQFGYRAFVALGVLSDKPWFIPEDLDRAFQSVAPNAFARAGSGAASEAFRAAQHHLGREIPRSHRSDLLDRAYRNQINLVLLQTFGLGAARLGSGVLQPIATDFDVNDWPSPRTDPALPSQPATRSESDAEEVTWQELLPLLQRHRVRYE